jgi:hypothetical protein
LFFLLRSDQDALTKINYVGKAWGWDWGWPIVSALSFTFIYFAFGEATSWARGWGTALFDIARAKVSRDKFNQVLRVNEGAWVTLDAVHDQKPYRDLSTKANALEEHIKAAWMHANPEPTKPGPMILPKAETSIATPNFVFVTEGGHVAGVGHAPPSQRERIYFAYSQIGADHQLVFPQKTYVPWPSKYGQDVAQLALLAGHTEMTQNPVASTDIVARVTRCQSGAWGYFEVAENNAPGFPAQGEIKPPTRND